MLTEFRAAPLQAHHEVEPWVDDGEALHPDVLEDPHDGELAVLVDERVVTE
jgi:hypothetical protein